MSNLVIAVIALGIALTAAWNYVYYSGKKIFALSKGEEIKKNQHEIIALAKNLAVIFGILSIGFSLLPKW